MTTSQDVTHKIERAMEHATNPSGPVYALCAIALALNRVADLIEAVEAKNEAQ